MASSSGPGVTQLQSLDAVHVRQKATRLAENKYTVLSPDGEVILYAKEDSSTLTKYLGGTDRRFKINLFDVDNTRVIHLRRADHICSSEKMHVMLHGQQVSVVRQQLTWCKPVLTISDANEQPFLKAKGPRSITGEMHFRLFNTNKQQVGDIHKTWQGWRREMLANKDFYQITFPTNASLDVKAAIIGTCIYIDFLHFGA